MTTLLTALFYLWLVITILLAAMWFVRRLDERKAVEQDEEDVYGLPSEDDYPTAQPLDQPAQATVEPETELEIGDSDPEADSAAETEPTAEADSEAQAEPETQTTAEPDPTAETVAEAEPSAAAPSPVIDDGSLAALLAQADLPYDLTPTADRATTNGEIAERVTLRSTHPDAADVGTAFADELVRLGYNIEPDGMDKAKAVRDESAFFLRIHPDAAGVEQDGEPRFPTAGPADVVIEVWS